MGRAGTLRPPRRCQLQLYRCRGPSPSRPGCPSLPQLFLRHTARIYHISSPASAQPLALPDCAQLWRSQAFSAGPAHLDIFWGPRTLRALTYGSSSLSLGQGQGSVIISYMTLEVLGTRKAAQDGGLFCETGGGSLSSDNVIPGLQLCSL